ncbi:MAG: PEP-CTERM/exosortase system-associated acyltransferase [Halorhodospira sp.]
MRNDNPFTSFQKYFQIELIDTPSDICKARRRHESGESLPDDFRNIRELFRLRHNVYCEEFQYEPLQPDGLEMDDYDERSWHAVLRYRGANGDKPSGQLAGCVRVVYSEPVVGHPALPLQAHYHHPFFANGPSPEQFEASTICEISRLAVHQGFRRRAKEQEAKEGAISMPAKEQVRTFPLLAAGLFAAAAATIIEQRKDHIFVMMEPKLHHRLHRKERIRFAQIGVPINFRGQRAPYYLNAEEGQHDLRASPNLAPLYEIVRQQLGITP